MATETAKFLESSATVFSKDKTSKLGSFARAAGFAAAITLIAPTVPDGEVTTKAVSTDIAAIDEINRVVTLKKLDGAPRVVDAEAEMSAKAETRRFEALTKIDVNAVTDAVARLRLDDINSQKLYHQYGDYKVPHNVLKELVRAAKDADFPTDYLFGIVEKESSFNCHAEPPSGSARGCMQVIDQTWLRLVKEYGMRFGLAEEAALVELAYNKRKQPVYRVNDKNEAQRILDLRYDVYYAAVLAVTDLKSAKNKIEKNLAAKFDDDNLYLPHFMGEDRAEVALAAYDKRPNATASKIFQREARANPGMFYDGKGRRRIPIDVAGFIKRAQDVILSRSAKYHNVESVAQRNSLDFVASGAVPIPAAKPIANNEAFISAMKSRIASRKLPLLPTLDGNLELAEYVGPRL